MSFLYFAYGSNMLSSRLIARCSSAKVIDKAAVQNHTLEFSKPSKDTSGKATLIPSAGRELQTYGVLFEIKKGERNALDKAEGAGYGYDRNDVFNVLLSKSDETVAATTYLATEPQPDLRPFDWYLALVIAGALEHDLDARHVSELLKIPHDLDSDKTRKSRQDALEALAIHGYHDHMKLLQH